MITSISVTNKAPSPIAPKDLQNGKLYDFVYNGYNSHMVRGLVVSGKFVQLIDAQDEQRFPNIWGDYLATVVNLTGKFYLSVDGIQIVN